MMQTFQEEGADIFVTANSYQQNNFRLIKNYLKPTPHRISGKSVSSNFTSTHSIHLSVFIYCQSMF